MDHSFNLHHHHILRDKAHKVSGGTVALLVAILVIGAVLRYYHLSEVEPFLADEAAYVLEARYIYSLLSTARQSLKLKREEIRTGKDVWKKDIEQQRFTQDLEGRVPWYARPGHLYLICLAMKLLGPDNLQAAATVSACFGTLSIVLVFILTNSLYGSIAGLVAAGLFSLSAVQVLYSRSFLTEQDSMFFFLLALLFYVSNRKAHPEQRWCSLVVAGLLMGVSFVIHYRMITYIAALWLLEAPFWCTTHLRSIRNAILRSLVLAGSILVPIVCTELPYYMAMLFTHFALKTTIPFNTYIEQLIGQFLYLVATYADSPATGIAAINVLTYPYLVWIIEGPLTCIALFGGIVFFSVRTKGFPKHLIVVLFLVPWVSCTLFNPRTRYLSGFLPFGLIMLGASVQGLRSSLPLSRSKLQALICTAALVALFASALSHAVRAIEPTTSYRKAIAFLKERGAHAHLATFPLLSQVYVGVRYVPDQLPSSEEELHEAYQHGYRYLIVDFVKDVIDVVVDQFHLDKKGEKFATFKRRIDLVDHIESTTPPVYTCPNLHIGKVYNLFEVNQHFTTTMAYARAVRSSEKAMTIRVYDLERYFLATD